MPGSAAAAQQQHILSSTGSLSGFRPGLQRLGSNYLSASRARHQAFCGNAEGWGPLSPHRYDFTPCFMDVWVSSVAVFGILFGAVAVWWLVRRKQTAEVQRDWHFWSKQVSFVLLLVVILGWVWCALLGWEGKVGGLYMWNWRLTVRIGAHCGHSSSSGSPVAVPDPQLS